MSSKNQPQLAYMSSVARCSSSSRRAPRRARSPPAVQRGRRERRQRAIARRRRIVDDARRTRRAPPRDPGTDRPPRPRRNAAAHVTDLVQRPAQRTAPGLVTGIRRRPCCSRSRAASAPGRARSSRRSPRRRGPRQSCASQVGGWLGQVGAQVRHLRSRAAPPRCASRTPASGRRTSCGGPTARRRTRTAPAADRPTRERSAEARDRVEQALGAVGGLAERDRARQRTVEDAERDRPARAVAVAPHDSRAPVSSDVAVDRRPLVRPPPDAPPRSARAPGSCSGRPSSISVSSVAGDTAGLGQPQPLGGVAEAPLEVVPAPTRAACARPRRAQSGTIGCAYACATAPPRPSRRRWAASASRSRASTDGSCRPSQRASVGPKLNEMRS